MKNSTLELEIEMSDLTAAHAEALELDDMIEGREREPETLRVGDRVLSQKGTVEAIVTDVEWSKRFETHFYRASITEAPEGEVLPNGVPLLGSELMFADEGLRNGEVVAS